MTTYSCELAWLPPGRVAAEVAVEVHGSRITSVTEGAAPPGERLHGLVLPGLANTHSHAFHRALRGHTSATSGGAPGTFWTWREQMYAVAAALDPDTYLDLARATYAEMALAGITCVGEFHYLHHQPGGRPYADPNVMGLALVQAAREAGLRITLLDTCYLAGGPGAALEGVQLRFGDGSGQAWAERMADLRAAVAGGAGDRGSVAREADALVAGAVHSARAVPPEHLGSVVEGAEAFPLHVHVSEQREENDAIRAAYGVTPTRLLHDHGVLGPRTTAIHATHLAAADLALLGSSRTGVCMCPTTERDLADGVGPASGLLAAGSPISLGTDSHAVIDLIEEARALELDERLVSGQRGRWPVAGLLEAATVAGHRSLGYDDAGTLSAGAYADLVAVRLDSVRTAGGSPADAAQRVVFAATAADVTDVIVSGRRVVQEGHHLLLGDVGRQLATSISSLG